MFKLNIFKLISYFDFFFFWGVLWLLVIIKCLCLFLYFNVMKYIIIIDWTYKKCDNDMKYILVIYIYIKFCMTITVVYNYLFIWLLILSN